MQREFYRQSFKQTVTGAVPVPLFENGFMFRKLHADNYNPSSSALSWTLIFLLYSLWAPSLFLSLSPSHLCFTHSLTATCALPPEQYLNAKITSLNLYRITAEPSLKYLLCNSTIHILQNPNFSVALWLKHATLSTR